MNWGLQCPECRYVEDLEHPRIRCRTASRTASILRRPCSAYAARIDRSVAGHKPLSPKAETGFCPTYFAAAWWVRHSSGRAFVLEQNQSRVCRRVFAEWALRALLVDRLDLRVHRVLLRRLLHVGPADRLVPVVLDRRQPAPGYNRWS